MAIAQILGCCEPTPPPPVDVNVLNCDGSTSAVTYPQAPMPVEIVQTKPFIICKSSVDFEIGCSSVDGRMLVRSFVQDEDGTITSQVFEQDGVTAVTDGSTLVNCSAKDIEDVESCFQDVTDKSITYRQVVFVETATQTVVASIWLNSKGVAIDAPLNVEPCKEEKLEGSVAVKIDCETTSIENFSDTVKALIPHVVQVQEICKIDEIDFIHTNWLPICIGGVQWYVAEEYTFNNTTLIKTLVGKVYKQGANGAIGVAVPVGDIQEGYCKYEVTVSDRDICATMANGDIWNVVERVTITNGVSVVSYLDPDTSPVADVTATYGSILHAGKCDCCDAKNNTASVTPSPITPSPVTPAPTPITPSPVTPAPTPANGALVSDNFQDGNNFAPFNLQIRNTTGNNTLWQAVLSNKPYATIPSLQTGNYTLVTTNNGNGTYTHTFTATTALGGYQNITIQGAAPTPQGNGGNLAFYIV
jgi:hypothetical protein